MKKKKRLLSLILSAALFIPLLPVTALAADGGFTVEGGTENTDYTYSGGVLTVNDGANLTISMKDGVTSSTSDRIMIAQSATATITLDGVDIKATGGNSAIDLGSGSNLTLILANGSDNKLVAGDNTYGTQGSGIHVIEGTTLMIQCSSGENGHTCSETCGELTIESGFNCAGIGGKQNESCGTVVINGGVVVSTGGNNAAGIGGGDHGKGGNITINGGIVTATGSIGGAGIGGAGEGGTGGKVTISGGIVTATDTPSTSEYGNAAGIGGGYQSAGAEVIITGGIVTATGHGGAGIGGGTNATDGSFSTSMNSTNGNAVIFASGTDGDIGDDEDTSAWSGVIFQGTLGRVYGDVTITDSFTVPSGYTLIIPSGSKLTIPENLTITNNGSIIMLDNGVLTPTNKVTGNAVQQNYTVAFDVGGIGTAPGNYLPIAGHVCPKPDDPTADGYTFEGWYKEAECINLWDFSNTVTAPMTLYAAWTPDAPDADAVTIDYEKETISFDSTLEVNTSKTFDGTDIANNGSVTDYIKDSEATVYVRVKANGNVRASEATEVTVPARPTAPTGITGGEGEMRGVTGQMQYSADGENWTDCDGTAVTGLVAGTYQVRYKATKDAFASKAVSVTVLKNAASPSEGDDTAGGTKNGEKSDGKGADAPLTGDTSRTLFLAVVMLMSGAGVTALAFSRRRKER